jgi:hypothetical protein
MAGFGPFVQAYQDSSPAQKVNSNLQLIQENPVQHQLYDFLFSVPRFTKCLFRQDYDMYRRWKGISNIVLILLYEKYFGWEETTIRRSLSAKESSKLYASLSEEDNESPLRGAPVGIKPQGKPETAFRTPPQAARYLIRINYFN